MQPGLWSSIATGEIVPPPQPNSRSTVITSITCASWTAILLNSSYITEFSAAQVVDAHGPWFLDAHEA